MSTVGFKKFKFLRMTEYNRICLLYWFFTWTVCSALSESCSCGLSSSKRILGGDVVDGPRYPWMSTLHYWHNGVVFCGAVLVSRRHALTAAHCTRGRDHSLFAIAPGIVDIGEILRGNVMEYRLDRVIEHEWFDEEEIINDIALLITKDDVHIGAEVSPICLPGGKSNLESKTVKILGWGWTTDGGRTMSRQLREVKVLQVPPSMCRKLLHWSASIGDPTQMCTYSKGKDSCQGDSGGPVVFLDPATHRYILVGLVSFGEECGGTYPSVNTDVSAFLDWIQDSVRGSVGSNTADVCIHSVDETTVYDDL